MSSTRMINVGCGERFLATSEWVNLDFSSKSPAVRRHNLLTGIPLSSDFADLVYSSHVLEHFARPQATALLLEMKRVVKPGGYVRIVLPDLEDICINYLDAVAKLRAGGRPEEHRWAIIELIDQLVRQTPGGEMARMHREILESGDADLRKLVIRRTGFDVKSMSTPLPRSIFKKLREASVPELKGKATTLYVGLVKRLLPRSLRMLVLDDTAPGEKHKWMYDRESLSALLFNVGFREVRFYTAATSGFAPFLKDNLDLNEDGTPYKRSSLYAEAMK